MHAKKIWVNLETEISKKLGKDSRIEFPNHWNEDYLKWMKKIEKESFREKLRYLDNEIIVRINHPGLFLFFLLVDNYPEAFLLGYRFLRKNPKTFYLDSIAVKHSGRGIGTLILKYLINWAKKKKFNSILLNTELTNEKGFQLKRFYENFGFKVIIKKKSNLTMRLNLNP